MGEKTERKEERKGGKKTQARSKSSRPLLPLIMSRCNSVLKYFVSHECVAQCFSLYNYSGAKDLRAALCEILYILRVATNYFLNSKDKNSKHSSGHTFVTSGLSRKPGEHLMVWSQGRPAPRRY